MIFDRSQNDVIESIRIRNEKIKKFIELTNAEKEILEKGFLTINTINRIESKQEELKNRFNEIGYYNTPTENKSWSKGDIFFDEDFKRILNNNILLRDSFFETSDMPQNDIGIYGFEEINKIEKILNDLELSLEFVKSNYKICGTFKCGE